MAAMQRINLVQGSQPSAFDLAWLPSPLCHNKEVVYLIKTCVTNPVVYQFDPAGKFPNPVTTHDCFLLQLFFRHRCSHNSIAVYLYALFLSGEYVV